jgi:hypothetical protein
MFIIALFSSYCFALLLSLAIEIPVMNLDKILFGGSGSKRRPRPVNAEPTNAEGQNGNKKKSVELGEFKNNDELDENGVKMAEQREPLVSERPEIA